MKAKETALVLIEYQNEFCSPDGALYEGVKEELARQGTIPNTVELVKEAREAGVSILHIAITFTDDYRELENPAGILKSVVEAKAFRKGTKGAETIDELKPAPGDILVEGKRTLCGFASTNLDFILRSKGIKNVAICGFLTNICVESTARTAYDKGYSVTIVKDCTAATSEEEQRFAEENIFPALGEVMTHEELLKEIDWPGPRHSDPMTMNTASREHVHARLER